MSLTVIELNDGEYFVSSEEGKIAYRVTVEGDNRSCTCADFSGNIQKDPQFVCKHILATVTGNGNIFKIESIGNRKAKLDERFVMEIQGREFVKYSGVLDLAHQKGLQSIQVEVIQFPTKDNGLEAVCKAIVESRHGDMFIEFGDANPKNTNQKIVNHILRMAATRAKARALRDFTNIGMTCLEELADLDEATDEKNDNSRARNAGSRKSETSQTAPETKKESAPPVDRGLETESKPNTSSKLQPQQPEPDNESRGQQKNDIAPSAAQIKAIENLSRRKGVTSEELDEIAQQRFGAAFQNITGPEASTLIRHLQQSA